MTEAEPGSPQLGTQPGGPGDDPLAARLLAARRTLTAPDIDPDVRTRLQLRFMAICTSLKMPAANRARGAERLDRLIADAELARRGTCAAWTRPAGVDEPDSDPEQEPEAHRRGGGSGWLTL